MLYQDPRPYQNLNGIEYSLIAHAGGEIYGKKYTNSLESLERAFLNGYKFIELDLLQTTDGHIVAAHDWKHFNKITGFAELGDTPLSLKEFMERRIYQKYTPIDATYITQAFNSHPDVCLVTDKIQNFQAILEQLLIPRDRLFVEVFSLQDYMKALGAGIYYPMLCIWGPKTYEQYEKYLHSGYVKMVTFSLQHYDQMKSELQNLIHNGISVFAFTSNDICFIQNTVGIDISAFYTDSVVPKDIEQ